MRALILILALNMSFSAFALTKEDLLVLPRLSKDNIAYMLMELEHIEKNPKHKQWIRELKLLYYHFDFIEFMNDCDIKIKLLEVEI